MRSMAAAASAGESARITPRLPDSAVGLITQGYDTPGSRATSSGRAASGTRTNHGVARPAALKRRRARSLLVASITDRTGCPGRPRASLT